MRKTIITLSLGLLFGAFSASAQISQGGTPPSFGLPQLKATPVSLTAPSIDQISNEDAQREKNGEAWRMAVAVKAGLNTRNSGTWTNIGRGEKIWQLKLTVKGAKALGVYYDRFYIPEGGRLFLYNHDKSQVIGAFTSENNPKEIGNFATELISGSEVNLEYFQPAYVRENPILEIGELAFAYRGIQDIRDFQKLGESASCEVNVNCSEGTNWQNHKRSVAKIVLKQGASYYLCTGAVVNNTAQDGKPYFLTAEHCGVSSSAADFNQWVFYFNYEASGCTSPGSDPASQTITGCVKRSSSADGGGNSGSDFKLLEFNSAIPASYGVYYAGWNKTNTASPSGVGIHHPSGDIKKISTYTGATTSTSWGGSVANTHWRVVWTATANGHGVTEGGSSGSPLFDNNGRIVGSLTGGGSYCTATSSPDSYGKMSYHWNANGTTADKQAGPWLDPANTGALTIDGAFLTGNPGPQPITYCTSKGNSVADEWIQSVAIGSFSKNSGKNAGYADFTTDKITLEQGKAYSFTLTPGFTSSQYNEYWKMWIDYNKDGDFDDAGELIYDAGSAVKTARTGSFTIPANATVQETRIRISMKYNGAQTACEAFSYGEVEDYTAKITTAAPVSCNTPTNVGSGSVTSSSFAVSWTAASGASSYEVQYKAASASTWTTATTSATSYTVSGLAASTAYNYQVRTVCGSSFSGYSAIGNVSTSAAPPANPTYCTSKGTTVTDEWIKSVAIGSINNVSNANAGYRDFTNLSTNLEIGEGTAITLTPGFKTNFLGQPTTQPEWWRVWVDLNADGDFTDAGELAYDAGATSTATKTGSVVIPAGTSPKTTRMRVQMKYNAAPTSCETFTYGEVEDYKVVLVDTRSALLPVEASTLASSINLYPNPSKGLSTVELNTDRDYSNLTITVMDFTGKVIQRVGYNELGKGTALKANLDLTSVTAGMYLVQIVADGTALHTQKLTIQ